MEKSSFSNISFVFFFKHVVVLLFFISLLVSSQPMCKCLDLDFSAMMVPVKLTVVPTPRLPFQTVKQFFNFMTSKAFQFTEGMSTFPSKSRLKCPSFVGNRRVGIHSHLRVESLYDFPRNSTAEMPWCTQGTSGGSL